MRRVRVGLVTVGLVALWAAAPVAMGDVDGHGDPSTNSWSSHCSPTQQAKYDPIMEHGGGVSMHRHDFFGANIQVTDKTTPADLQAVSTPSPSCNSAFKFVDPPDQGQQCFVHVRAPYEEDLADDGEPEVCDDTAYWTPALVERTNPESNDSDDQTPMTPAYALTYYRNENIADPHAFEEFPSNYAVVAGDQDASSQQDPWVVAWSCVQAGAPDQDPIQVMPDACVDRESGADDHPLFLRMVITFPDCVEYAAQANKMIQPVLDGTADAHVAYTNDDTPTQSCPASVTPAHLIPFIQVGVRWNLNTAQFDHVLEGKTYDLSNFYLVSDFQGGRDPVTHGVSAHADFMSGWTQATLDALMPACLHQSGHVNCGYVGGSGT